MRLSENQVTEALARLSPAANAIAIVMAKSEPERERIRNQAIEVPSVPVAAETVEKVAKLLADVPPVRFSVARQVRVYSAYLQYVELSLTGAAIQRHRLTIPPSIQKLGGAKDIQGRLKTTFDLIEKDGKLSSKKLEGQLNEIRNNLTHSLGKNHGRVVLKSAKPVLDKRLDEFRTDLEKFQEKVENELQSHLDESRKQIVDYYVAIVVKNPPDAMRGQFLKFGKTEAEKWLSAKLDKVLPKAKKLTKKMQLDVRYKDVTYETLNSGDFLDQIKKVLKLVDWDKAYSEYCAAGEEMAPIRNDSNDKTGYPSGYGANNVLVSRERAALLRERLKVLLRDQLNAGINPELMAIGAEVTAYHIEAGARKIIDFSRDVSRDHGATTANRQPYMRSWYIGARDIMEDNWVPIDGVAGAAGFLCEAYEYLHPKVTSPTDYQTL